MNRKSEQAGGGSASREQQSQRSPSEDADIRHERPAASEPSLPDSDMEDPTGSRRPGPVEEPDRPGRPGKIRLDSPDLPAGSQEENEPEDLVGPQEDAPRAGGPAVKPGDLEDTPGSRTPRR